MMKRKCVDKGGTWKGKAEIWFHTFHALLSETNIVRVVAGSSQDMVMAVHFRAPCWSPANICPAVPFKICQPVSRQPCIPQKKVLVEEFLQWEHLESCLSYFECMRCERRNDAFLMCPVPLVCAQCLTNSVSEKTWWALRVVCIQLSRIMNYSEQTLKLLRIRNKL